MILRPSSTSTTQRWMMSRIKLDLAAIKQAHPKATTLTVYVARMVASTLVGTISLAN
ncbi:hypothetical protein [Secundilactobacillus silagei]|uniref:hypothetical protein n=1 Tax=Secundilactobacillus silagei TaxID=1293415 RepID=UPI002093B630|nr:hypothetical protein [Secundilactobacillus silagei]